MAVFTIVDTSEAINGASDQILQISSYLFFLFRSLAYNNLETLPKDLFKGLEALTKV